MPMADRFFTDSKSNNVMSAHSSACILPAVFFLGLGATARNRAISPHHVALSTCVGLAD